MNVRREPDAAGVTQTYSYIASDHTASDGPSFNEVLFEWMERAPWIVISLAAHVVLLLILSLVPWGLFEDQGEETILVQHPDLPPEDVYDDPPKEEELVIVEEDIVQEPEIFDEELVPDPSPVDMADDTMAEGDPTATDRSPFENIAGDGLIGIGGGSGDGHFGNRTGDGNGPRKGGHGTPHVPIQLGLQWLIDHQDADGKWDADEFMKHDADGEVCTGAGQAEHDVGITSLALLALLGDGHTTSRGEYREQVSRGVRWLTDQQDPDTGLIGERIGHSYMYDHGIATLVLCEAYYFSKSPLLKPKAQAAISFVTLARNPYGVWRYDMPPNGDHDTSVTGWMILALKSAQEAGLVIDSSAFLDTLSYLDEVTDEATGRAGYAARGEPSSRIPNVNDHFPTEGTEAMTSVAILCRAFLGQTPEDTPVMRKGAELLRNALPEHDPDGMTNDLYYWYYGSYAMFQLGGRDWKAWSRALDGAVVQTQGKSGNEQGSWNPDGPWGGIGGRVYSTALGVLCLEAYYRYSRVLGGR